MPERRELPRLSPSDVVVNTTSPNTQGRALISNPTCVVHEWEENTVRKESETVLLALCLRMILILTDELMVNTLGARKTRNFCQRELPFRADLAGHYGLSAHCRFLWGAAWRDSLWGSTT